MLTPISFTPRSIQDFYPLFLPLRTFSQRFSIFSWQSAVIVSIVITIAVLFENKRRAEDCQKLAAENVSLKLKATDHQRQLTEANWATKLWQDIYVNSVTPKEPLTPFNPSTFTLEQKRQFIRELQDVLARSIESLKELIGIIFSEVSAIPTRESQTSIQEVTRLIDGFRDLIHQIIDHKAVFAAPITNQTREDFVNITGPNTPLVALLSKQLTAIKSQLDLAVSRCIDKETTRLRDIVKIIERIIGSIQKQNERLIALLEESPNK